MDRREFLKKFAMASVMTYVGLGCSCATVAVYGPPEIYSYKPTVINALDSLESARLAIMLSNEILLKTPLSDLDEWPSALYATNKKSLWPTRAEKPPTAIDINPNTGFPQPVSRLHKTLKEYANILASFDNKNIGYFASQPESVIYRDVASIRQSGKKVSRPVYRNMLMAYGVVTANKQGVLEIEQELENVFKGFMAYGLFTYLSTEEVKDGKIFEKAFPTIKSEEIESKLASKMLDNKEERKVAEKEYGKLADNLYRASVAGADYTSDSITRIAAASIFGTSVLQNINNEFAGIEINGNYNIDRMISRIKEIPVISKIYIANLRFMFSVYKTMYQQIKATYEIKDDEQTKDSLQRIRAMETAMAELEPKLNLALAGGQLDFSDSDARRLNMLSAIFP